MAHYYDSEGRPRYFEGKDGSGTTLPIARKHGYIPSVTTIIGEFDPAYALRDWIARECVKSTLDDTANWQTYDWQTGEVEWSHGDADYSGTLDEYAAWVVRIQRQITMAKADEGSDIHELLEDFASGGWDEHAVKIGSAVFDLLHDTTGVHTHEWIAEKSFAHTEDWFAGKCDLHSDGWVIDFKTKDDIEAVQKGSATWHREQLHAYAHGLGLDRPRLGVVFISRNRDDWDKPEAVKFSETKWDDHVLRVFREKCRLWSIVKKHGPHYEALEMAA